MNQGVSFCQISLYLSIYLAEVNAAKLSYSMLTTTVRAAELVNQSKRAMLTLWLNLNQFTRSINSFQIFVDRKLFARSKLTRTQTFAAQADLKWATKVGLKKAKYSYLLWVFILL